MQVMKQGELARLNIEDEAENEENGARKEGKKTVGEDLTICFRCKEGEPGGKDELVGSGMVPQVWATRWPPDGVGFLS